LAVTLEDYMKREHTPVLVKRGNVFCFVIVELSLVGEGSTVDSAYLDLEKKKKAYFAQVIDRGLHSYVPTPGQNYFSGRNSWRLKSVFIKAGAFALAFSVCLLILFPVLTSYVKREIKSMAPLEMTNWADIGIKIPQTIGRKLESAPPEKKEALRREWSALHRTICKTFEDTSISDSLCSHHEVKKK